MPIKVFMFPIMSFLMAIGYKWQLCSLSEARKIGKGVKHPAKYILIYLLSWIEIFMLFLLGDSNKNVFGLIFK